MSGAVAVASARRNPFDDPAALAHSQYCGVAPSGEVIRLAGAGPPSSAVRSSHLAFRRFVRDDAFSCLGARAALQQGTYRFGAYGDLAGPEATAGLARDLYTFVRERPGFGSDFTSFIAFFAASRPRTELAFEADLWAQLGRLHALDRRYFGWDPRVSDDPESPEFSFSFAGTAFFVVGMHPGATRTARRFVQPTIVFNAAEQFTRLRATGRFLPLQKQIRARELRLQGSLNANLADHGVVSEARQYAGRPTDGEWRCPFRT